MVKPHTATPNSTCHYRVQFSFINVPVNQEDLCPCLGLSSCIIRRQHVTFKFETTMGRHIYIFKAQSHLNHPLVLALGTIPAMKHPKIAAACVPQPGTNNKNRRPEN